MSGIVRYNNDMNLVQFNKFKDKELDLFFSICYELKEKGLKEINLEFSELKELSNYTNRNLERFVKDLDNTYKKLIQLNFKFENEKILHRFVLFTEYKIDKEKKNVTIAVNEKFKYILNELGTTYTKFELEQFVSLRSTYSKNLFKILKQWETVKEKEFEIEEFKRVLNIPSSYDFSKLNDKILKKTFNELVPYFSNLKLEKIKRGRQIVKLKFTWAAQNMKQAKLLEIEIIISEKLEKTIEKAKKNKFMNPILVKENIKKLLEIFDEKILINAFNKAYTEIKKEINFNYLKTYIKNSLKQQEIKFVVQTEAQEVEVVKEKEEEEELKKEIREPKELIKITLEQKEEMYQEYLRKTNSKDNKINRKTFEFGILGDNYKLVEEEVNVKKSISQEKYNNLFVEEVNNQNKLTNISTKSVLEAIATAILNEKYKIESSSLKPIKQEECLISDDIVGPKTMDYKELKESLLLSKSGKKLFGGALTGRLKKIAMEENIKIKYKDKIISF